jgi:porin
MRRLLTLLYPALLLSAPAFADGLPSEMEESSNLTGNWGGARKKLKKAGVDIDMSYANDLLGNPSGGQQHGFANAGSFDLALNLDLEKIATAKGLSLTSTFIFRSGNNLSEKINNDLIVAELFTAETYQLSELYLKETLFDNALVMKAGRLSAGDDFLTSALYNNYVSLAINNNPIGIYFNSPFLSAIPYATWGAYLDFKPHPRLLMKWGVYNNNVDIFKNRYHGVNFTFHSTSGVTAGTEWVFLNNQRPQDRGFAGNYTVGWYYITGMTPKFAGGNQRGNFAAYFQIDQMVIRRGGAGSSLGLTPFAALVFAPPNRNQFPFFLLSGLVYKGMPGGRDDDSLNFGVAYGRYSSALRRSERLAGTRPQTSETALELNYTAQVNKWLILTPDVQYIINPKGLGTIQNALVIGMQIAITI